MHYEQSVTAAIRWAPEVVGDYLEGVFEGVESANGPHGPYERYRIRAKGRAYWTTSASLHECYEALEDEYKKPGTRWKIECIAIDDFSLPGKRVASYTLHARSA